MKNSLDTAQVAEILNRSERTITRWVTQDKLKADIAVGKKGFKEYRFDYEYIQSQKNKIGHERNAVISTNNLVKRQIDLIKTVLIEKDRQIIRLSRELGQKGAEIGYLENKLKLLKAPKKRTLKEKIEKFLLIKKEV